MSFHEWSALQSVLSHHRAVPPWYSSQVKQRERIYQQYAGMFDSYDAFSQVMLQCTENYECLVIDNKVQSNKIEDQVYWYKATDRQNFKLCSPELWNLQALESERQSMGLVRKPDEDEDGPYNPQIIKKKNQPVIRVSKGY